MEVHYFQGAKHAQFDDFQPEYIPVFRNIQHRFAGYVLDFCYHNCEVPLCFMTQCEASILESCVELRLSSSDFMIAEGVEYRKLLRVTEENYARFASLHDRVSAHMFWTSERITTRFPSWYIAMLAHGEGYVLMNMASDVAEIYALVASREQDRLNLLSAAAQHAFAMGKGEILFMVDEDAMDQARDACAVGYRECGKYIAYRVEHPITFATP